MVMVMVIVIGFYGVEEWLGKVLYGTLGVRLILYPFGGMNVVVVGYYI